MDEIPATVDAHSPAGGCRDIVRKCAVCGCDGIFYGRRPEQRDDAIDHVRHWKKWEAKGLTPPHEIRRSGHPRYKCSGGGRPYVEIQSGPYLRKCNGCDGLGTTCSCGAALAVYPDGLAQCYSCGGRYDLRANKKVSATTDILNGLQSIAAERQRQSEVEGPGHEKGEMASAAAAYAHVAAGQAQFGGVNAFVPHWWPWEEQWWKPSADPVQNLVKAGALIAAEINRLQRAPQRNESKSGAVTVATNA